ncbi:hypothetical protein [Aeromonas veronii]|uniref:PRTase-CE domain-containing protein n=1 Tax=Aeromonas veronii AMC34 TaxID=1073383 RepID=K1IRP7_AERVE|nr:hypothetical protein [Aeromonas veronii]EKB21720.1 hypothetical protein HMPREF1168_01272 [Aeromonas veronii AMC34]
MIRTEKNSNPEDFYKVGDVIERIPWLNDPLYAKGVHSLWEEFSDEAQRLVLQVLLERFTHHYHQDIYRSVDDLIDFVYKEGGNHKNSVIIGTATGMDSDGAMHGLYYFKNPLAKKNIGWGERNIVPVFSFACEKCKSEKVKNIFVFDDFIGSGNTLVKRINELKEFLELRASPFNIFVISFAGMEFGIQNLISSTGVEVYCPLILKKGISEYDSSDRDSMKETVLGMEKKLGSKWKKLKIDAFSLGYKQSETLYAVYRGNCSNNVFPIFWWPRNNSGGKRVTLFDRL